MTKTWIVTVKETVLSTYAVKAPSAEKAMEQWEDGSLIENAYTTLEAEAVKAVPSHASA